MAIAWIFAGLFLGFLSMAAIWDFAELRIPNRLAATMAVSGPVASWLLVPGGDAIKGVILTGAVVLGISWAMFERGWWGGGDAKLATAASLWLGAEATLVFMFATALFGAVLAVILLILVRWDSARALVGCRWSARLEAESVSVPYAVAMAPAGAVALSIRLVGLI